MIIESIKEISIERSLNSYQKEAKEKFDAGQLLTKGETNQKLDKSPEITYNLSLLPANLLQGTNKSTCSDFTEACKFICITFTGRASMFKSINIARGNKTNYYFNDNRLFTAHLGKNIEFLANKHKAKKEDIVLRLNTLSDIDFLHLLKVRANFDPTQFDNVKFYDYTANIRKALKYKDSKYIVHTFSRKENNWPNCEIALENNLNVSVVFEDKLPKTYKGYKVINGDLTDTEMLRYKGVILGLKAKGNKAKLDKSGFVVRPNMEGQIF